MDTQTLINRFKQERSALREKYRKLFRDAEFDMAARIVARLNAEFDAAGC